jgi:aminoglycoside 2''-phosphotransferase
MATIHEHNVTLRDEDLVLRPMTEADWDILSEWNRDPQVLYYSEGGDVQEYDLATVQQIYRGTSQNALCFVIEFEGVPIGECWLQRMNLERILAEYPGRDCRRVDLMIGEKEFWGRGLGTRTIRLLVELAFKQEEADAVFACEVGDYNPRSRRAFEKVGFEVYASIPQLPGSKASVVYDLLLTRETHLARQA